MTLTGTERAELQRALLRAFRDRAALARMVSFHLDLNLEEVTSGDDLRNVVFDLITWAESSGRVVELVTKAREENPGNLELRAFADALEKRPTKTTQGSGGQESTGHAFWAIGVAALGLWPLVGGGDDPFLWNPMCIAGGLVLLSFLKPIAPNAALAFVVVPYALNLFGFYVSYERSFFSYVSRLGVAIDAVALFSSLVVVLVVCKTRTLRCQQSSHPR